MMKKLLFLFLGINLSVNSQVNLSSGLTACYALDANANDPIHNLNGLLSGVTPTVNRFGAPNSAYEFTGDTSSYIALPDDPYIKPANAFSFSCWLKAPLVHENYILFAKNSMSSYFEAYELCTDPSFHFMTRKAGPQGMDMVVSSSAIVANTWYHIAITIDNSDVKLYINGVLDGSTSSTFNGFDYQAGKKVYLGTSHELSFNGPFIGTLDNIRFYNRTITAAEVAQLYSQDPICKEVVATTSIGTYKNEDDLSIFPNPTGGVVHIDLGSNSNYNYYVSDVLGNTIIKSEETSSSKLEIDLSAYTAGVYFLNITTNKGSSIKKLIKE